MSSLLGGGHGTKAALHASKVRKYERSLLLHVVAVAFYASSVDSGSASGWVRYGFVQTVAPLASAFLALESARLSFVESETRSSRPRSVKAGALAEIMY